MERVTPWLAGGWVSDGEGEAGMVVAGGGAMVAPEVGESVGNGSWAVEVAVVEEEVGGAGGGGGEV